MEHLEQPVLERRRRVRLLEQLRDREVADLALRLAHLVVAPQLCRAKSDGGGEVGERARAGQLAGAASTILSRACSSSGGQ